MTTGSLLGPGRDPLNAWKTKSNDALELKLVRTTEDGTISGEEFAPEFTYPVFGEKEEIFGYRDLHVKLHYAAGSLATYFGIEYAQQYDERTRKVDDIPQLLSEHMSPGYTDNYDAFLDTVRRDETEFRPFGEKFYEYELDDRDGSGTNDGVVFEMYKCNFSTPGCKQYHKRIQLFLLWFIEGASFIEDTDPNWDLVFVYEKRKRNGQDIYSVVGYMTYYPFFYYPDKKR
ncbi:histone acetyltransferase 1, partial [Rhizophlyctis rosea]